MNLEFSINRETLLKVFKVGYLISEKESTQKLDFEQKSTVFWDLIFAERNIIICKMLFATERFKFVVSDICFNTDGEEIEEIEPIVFGINTHKLYKLLTNSTTDVVNFTLLDNELVVKTNGVYKFSLIDKDNIIFSFPEVLDNPEALPLINYTEFVDNFLKLKDFAELDLINPANSGIYIDEAVMTSHTAYSGCVLHFPDQVKLPISFDPEFYQPLAKLLDLEQVKLTTAENYIAIQGTMNGMFYYLEGRVLDGTFNQTFIELITNVMDNNEKLVTLNISKSKWQEPFSRIEPFITDLASINFVNGNLTLTSPDDTAEEVIDFPISGVPADFSIQIHPRDLQKFFRLSDNLLLTFSPKYEKQYHIIAIEATKFIDGIDQAVAVGFICRFDELS